MEIMATQAETMIVFPPISQLFQSIPIDFILSTFIVFVEDSISFAVKGIGGGESVFFHEIIL